MTNWEAHHLDIARWIVGARAPVAVSGAGGRYALKDGGETPDVQAVTYQFPGVVVTWTSSEISQGEPFTLDIFGTNFLEYLKTRQKPNADVEEGHLSAVMCHLGNISTRLGRTLRWDADKEQITGDAEANKWLEREYRGSWRS